MGGASTAGRRPVRPPRPGRASLSRRLRASPRAPGPGRCCAPFEIQRLDVRVALDLPVNLRQVDGGAERAGGPRERVLVHLGAADDEDRLHLGGERRVAEAGEGGLRCWSGAGPSARQEECGAERLLRRAVGRERGRAAPRGCARGGRSAGATLPRTAATRSRRQRLRAGAGARISEGHERGRGRRKQRTANEHGLQARAARAPLSAPLWESTMFRRFGRGRNFAGIDCGVVG